MVTTITVERLLDINEAVAGDTVEIWIDGVMVDEHALTAAEVTAGSATVGVDVDPDSTATNTSTTGVNVQVSVRHGSYDTQDVADDTLYTWS